MGKWFTFYVMNFIYTVVFRITLTLQIKNYLYVSFSKLLSI